jgi:hypothetical protein
MKITNERGDSMKMARGMQGQWRQGWIDDQTIDGDWRRSWPRRQMFIPKESHVEPS